MSRRVADQAVAFARAYVAFTEALLREGVTEETAREEARMAALVQAQMDEPGTPTYEPHRGSCPTCGRG